jgi:hypothetical protein
VVEEAEGLGECVTLPVDRAGYNESVPLLSSIKQKGMFLLHAVSNGGGAKTLNKYEP